MSTMARILRGARRGASQLARATSPSRAERDPIDRRIDTAHHLAWHVDGRVHELASEVARLSQIVPAAENAIASTGAAARRLTQSQNELGRRFDRLEAAVLALASGDPSAVPAILSGSPVPPRESTGSVDSTFYGSSVQELVVVEPLRELDVSEIRHVALALWWSRLVPGGRLSIQVLDAARLVEAWMAGTVSSEGFRHLTARSGLDRDGAPRSSEAWSALLTEAGFVEVSASTIQGPHEWEMLVSGVRPS